jgi:hypothetical protein
MSVCGCGLLGGAAVPVRHHIGRCPRCDEPLADGAVAHFGGGDQHGRAEFVVLVVEVEVVAEPLLEFSEVSCTRCLIQRFS